MANDLKEMKALATGFGDVHMAQDAQATKGFEAQMMEKSLPAKEVKSKPLNWDVFRLEVADIAKKEFTSFVHRSWVLCPNCKHHVPTFDRQLAECVFVCTYFEC